MSDTLAVVNLTGIVHRGWDDIRGWLLFDGLPAEVQRREDSTQHSDYELHDRTPRIRPATDAEGLLLTHLGFTLPSELDTVVAYPSGGVRRRTWPALERQREAMQ